MLARIEREELDQLKRPARHRASTLGRTDIPLTDEGEQGARTLAERLRAVTFSRVFTSPRRRAWDV